MKTFISILILFLFSFGSLNAQDKKMAVGAGLVISLPIGSFGDAANLGIGGTAAFELKFMPQLMGVGQIGYISYSTESDNISFSTVPLLLGVKYFFMPAGGFYGIGQLGINFFSTSTDIPSYNVAGYNFGGGSYSASSSEFTFALGAGYEVPVSPNVLLDFSGTFQLISNFNNILFRAGGKIGI